MAEVQPSDISSGSVFFFFFNSACKKNSAGDLKIFIKEGDSVLIFLYKLFLKSNVHGKYPNHKYMTQYFFFFFSK